MLECAELRAVFTFTKQGRPFEFWNHENKRWEDRRSYAEPVALPLHQPLLLRLKGQNFTSNAFYRAAMKDREVLPSIPSTPTPRSTPSSATLSPSTTLGGSSRSARLPYPSTSLTIDEGDTIAAIHRRAVVAFRGMSIDEIEASLSSPPPSPTPLRSFKRRLSEIEAEVNEIQKEITEIERLSSPAAPAKRRRLQ